jgi:hypothetical protein
MTWGLSGRPSGLGEAAHLSPSGPDDPRMTWLTLTSAQEATNDFRSPCSA